MAKLNKYANIYDLDGNLISKAPLKRKTLTEVEDIVDELTKKVQENPDNQMLKVQLNNTQQVLFSLYNSMSREDLMSRMSILKNSIEEAKTKANESEKERLDEANKALDELKSAYVDKEMERPLVVTPPTEVNSEQPLVADSQTVMDEYVNYEEIPENNG